MKSYRLSVFLFFVIAVSGCAPARNVLFIAEEYWWDILNEQPDFQQTLASVSQRNGYTLSFSTVPKGVNYLEYSRNDIQHRPCDIVIVSTLLASDAIRLAPLFPEKDFIVIPAPRLDEDLPPNLHLVTPDRREAFHEAGRITGRVLAETNDAFFGQRVGVILSGLTIEEKEMETEFERGFSQFAETERLTVAEIGTANDKVKAVRAVENLISQGVKVFFLKTYGLNSACMEKITNSGGYFIVEDFSFFNLFSKNLFLAIEDDYEKIFNEILKQAAHPDREPLFMTARVVRGTVLEKDGENNR